MNVRDLPLSTEISPDPAPIAQALGGKPIRVFVHLARGFGAEQWRERWKRGEIIGLNECLPYGFFWAREEGCQVEYSEDQREGPFAAAVRVTVRLLLGFDFVHAWRNRGGIYAAEIVWTGTESQYLAVLLLLRGNRRRDQPKVIAQNVWLLDSWSQLLPIKRWLYRRLIAGAAVLTVHSDEGLRAARNLFPDKRSLLIPYGIKADEMVSPRRRRGHRPIRVLSAGNDRHRDWATLLVALRDNPDAELRIVTRSFPPRLKLGGNIVLVRPKTNAEYIGLYRWADVVAVALRPNLHGSGITVIQEATVLGVPVVATDTGGLKGYFSEREVRYVPLANPAAMRDALVEAANDDDNSRMVRRAQRRILEGGLTSRRFAQRHVELSRELLYGVMSNSQ